MKIGLVSFGLEERNQRLQPWRYLLEAAGTLVRSGHEVYLISDGYPRLPREDKFSGLPVTRLTDLHDWPMYGNPQVVQAVTELRPDVVLWHLGLTGFLRLSTLKRISFPVVGVFTSPIYRPRELLRLGFLRLLRGYRLTAVHFLGLFVSKVFIQRALDQYLIDHLVVECKTTRARLIQRGAPGDRVHVIRPGIDPEWFEVALLPVEKARLRNELGFPPDAFVVGYFGPPAPLRGLPNLLRAVAVARERDSRIRLLILSRRHNDELHAEHLAIEYLITRLGAGQWTCLVTGFLPQERLIQSLSICDAIALPFEVVPSDVPLGVLEAMALGGTVITTQVACLPELNPKDAGLCLPSSNMAALADAICTLASDSGLRQGLGRAAKKRAASWGVWGQSNEIWDTLLRQQAKSQ
jgi:glycosyltransferase involved in cell wall biosynthesis